MKIWPEPVTLTGKYCTLEPLSLAHEDNLIAAASDGELWNLYYAEIPQPEAMKNTIIKRLEAQAKGIMLPFAVINTQTQQVVGTTTYCRTDQDNRRLDIGYTWYAKSQQKTALNTEAKLLLLTHAFEQLNCIAVGFRVDCINRQSQQAVARLGAKLDGIIRNYSILPNGNARDMYFYSILPHEWPHVKANLNWLLNKPRG